MSEWYANGPLGLEQGFTVASLPGGGGPLTLALRVSGNARTSLSSSGGGQSIVYSRAGAPVLSGHQLFISESTLDFLSRPRPDLVFVDELEVRGRKGKVRVWAMTTSSD